MGGGDKRQVERIDDANHLPRRAGLLERVAAAGREGERQEGESSHREAVSTIRIYKRASAETVGKIISVARGRSDAMRPTGLIGRRSGARHPRRPCAAAP